MDLDEVIRELMDGRFEGFEWFYFLSLALMLAFGTITFTGTVMDTERPVVSVISCSMYPQLHIGDILIVQGQEFSDIEENDVIVYRVPDYAEISVDGGSYTLEKNSPLHNSSVETSRGKVELVRVAPDLEPGRDGNTRDEVLLRVEGEEVVIEEGGSSRGVEVSTSWKTPTPIVHRVVDKREDSLETLGDNNDDQQFDFERNVRPFQVYGVSVFEVPRIGAVKLVVMDLMGYEKGDPVGLNELPVCRP